jgi:AraC-like DNA-binding protein
MALTQSVAKRNSSSQFLVDSDPIDEISLVNYGAANDAHSFAALYSRDRHGYGAVVADTGLDGFLAVVALRPFEPYILIKDRKKHQMSPVPQRGYSIHDLRSAWSMPRIPITTMNFAFSSAYLDDVGRSRRAFGMNLLQDHLESYKTDDTLFHLASALVPSCLNPDQADQLFVDQTALAACTYLISKAGSAPSAPLKGGLSIRQEKLAKEFLVANLDKSVALAEVADRADLSPSYFARAFKRTVGKSPYRWLMDERLRVTQCLLETTTTPLSEIALNCGFADQSHFTRTFSNRFGVSPGAWRRHHAL